jgi:metallo-beta-lactamase family protein
VREVEESKALSANRFPKVIISASGMATGGRVLHDLALHAGDHRNMIVLTGHQAGGTRGARIAAGEKSIRIFGQEVAIRAEVVQLATASAHADGGQLIDWLRASPRAPGRVCVVHGELAAADALRERIAHTLRWPAQVPEHGDTLTL